MSVEPTCTFCGASDKNRCRSMKDAMTCESARHYVPAESPDKIPQLSLSTSMGVGKVTVSTHQAGVSERLNVSIDRPKHGSGPVNFTLHPSDIDQFIDLLRKAQTYSKKGNL